MEDADGSLLVVDTGGWFLAGCPQSQVSKPDVRGGIYRIRRKGASAPPDPRGQSLPWDSMGAQDLALLLNDPRFAARDRAVDRLAELDAVDVLEKIAAPEGSLRARRNALWALCRVEGSRAREASRRFLTDADPGVRISAAHAIGLHRDVAARDGLVALLSDPDPAARREAATALGRLRRSEAVPALLEALRRAGSDRFLEHALIFALIEIGDAAATRRGWADPDANVRGAVLLALAQMPGGDLPPEEILPLLEAEPASLREAALFALGSRPEGSNAVTGTLRKWMKEADPSPSRREALRSLLKALISRSEVRRAVARSLIRPSTSPAMRVLLLEAVAGAPGGETRWDPCLRRNLDHASLDVRRAAMRAIESVGTARCAWALDRLARDTDQTAEVRLSALRIRVAYQPLLDDALFEFLGCRLAQDPPLGRLAAAKVLGRARLSAHHRGTLLEAVASAGALEIGALLDAFEEPGQESEGPALVGALMASPGIEGVGAGRIEAILARYGPSVRESAQPLLERVDEGARKRQERLTELEPLTERGDAVLGRQLFFGDRAACSTCHAVKGEGGRVGPDLGAIGSMRSGRDLLESILFPSASIARGYDHYVVATRSGEVHSGILAGETLDTITLFTADRSELRLPRERVESIRPGTVSVMPEGLDAQLAPEELGNLIAFLRSLR
jgi:putative heme-binding domain-containing protein